MKTLRDLLSEKLTEIQAIIQALNRVELAPGDNAYAKIIEVIKPYGWAIGSGMHSRGYYGREGGPWLIKVSTNTSSDNSFEYLEYALQNPGAHPWLPKVLYMDVLGGYEWAVMEKVDVLADHPVHDEIWKNMHYFQVKNVIRPYFNGVDSPRNDMLLKAFLDTLKVTKEDLDSFLDLLRQLFPGIPSSDIDLHLGNMGFRADGSLCVFDPVS